MIISTSLKKKKKNNRLVKNFKKLELPKKTTKDDLNKFNEWVNKKETDIRHELFKMYFTFQRPGDMLKSVYITNDKKNNNLVITIKSRLSDLKNEIENMSEEEKQIDKPNEIVNIAEKIFEFNDQTQRGVGLKTLTPDQMLSRLPITLAQLKAANNSEKLKNEIRQLLYSLYRSKKLTKTMYNHSINTI